MADIFTGKIKEIFEIHVHAGYFHADDVFCAAAARIISPDVVIKRVRERKASEDTPGIITADIGAGRYDHHQPDTPSRDDGIRHCAVTRLWLDCGVTAVERTAGYLNEEDVISVCKDIYFGIFKTIAMIDNGIQIPGGAYNICDAVDAFTPPWDSGEAMDHAFLRAVSFAQEILTGEIRKSAAVAKGKGIILEALGRMKNGIVTLDAFVPWETETVEKEDAKVIIYPSMRGEINLQLVPVEAGSFSTRICVPEEWKGRRGHEAAACMEGMSFCHASGFLSCFDTREHAVKAAEYLIRYNEGEKNAYHITG